MRGLSDSQQSTLIGVIARIPVSEARKLVLEKVEASLPKTTKVSDAQLLASINSALGSIPPGAFRGDSQGAYPRIDEAMSLKEAASTYKRMIDQREWSWPPVPPPTPEEMKALADTPREQLAEAYERSLFNSDEEWRQHQRAEKKRRAELLTSDNTPWPTIPAPPSTQVIRGEVNNDFPTDDDLRRAQLRAESDDERATREINERLKKERLLRRRRQGAPKVFFR